MQFFDSNGVPLNGGKLFTYAAGTTTKLATYTDSTGGTPNTNPVVLDSRGQCDVWLQPNVLYKYVLSPSADTDPPTNPIKTRDQISSVQLITLYGGIDTGFSNAYVLTFAASFSSYSNGVVIYWIPSNSNTGASTINVNGLGVVSIVNPDGSALGANQIVGGQMTQIVYSQGNFVLQSIASFTGSTVGTFGTETPLASAATVDLGSATAHVVLITGTTNISSFGSSANVSAPIYIVRFASALTLTYSASTMILPGGTNITTAAGDALIAEYLGSGTWKVLIYQYGAGNAQTKVKPADTQRISNAALTVDPDLVSNTLAVGKYAWEAYLIFDSVTAGAGFQWTNVGTAVDSRGVAPAIASGFVNAAAYGPKSETPYGVTITYATVGAAANSNIVLYKGSLLVSTPGTFGVSWAQAVSTATNTTLRAGSYLTTSLASTGTAAGGVTHSYASGTGTETVPAGVTTLVLEVWSGSGGGGAGFGTIGLSNNAGGGGGAGGSYSRSTLPVSGHAGENMTYTVGAAGTAGVAGGNSTVVAGTFAMTTMTANGGNPGTAATSSILPGNGGAGGTATGGTVVNTTGNAGKAGQPQGGPGFHGGFPGAGIGGINGGGPSGGLGAQQVGAGSAGNAGLIIFSYQ